MTLEVPYNHEPFTSMEHQELIHQICVLGSRPPVASHTPPPLKDLLARCWRRDPALRPDAATVHTELVRHFGRDGEGVTSTSTLSYGDVGGPEDGEDFKDEFENARRRRSGGEESTVEA